MKKKLLLTFLICSVLFGMPMLLVLAYMHPKPAARDQVNFGLRHGEALRFEVITPKKSNGLGLIFIVCGNWESIPKHDYNVRHTAFYHRKGFTIFKLYHASPIATIPETVEDIQRGIRYVRLNAKRWNIDPDRIGLLGRSSGGQLALCAALKSDDGDPTSEIPLEQQSSHVQACGVFYPVCELYELNKTLIGSEPPIYEQYNFGEGAYDAETWKKIAYEMSPINHIHSKMPPIMISHGEADLDVPIEQPKLFVKLAEETNAHPVRLVTHPGITHNYDRITMFSDRYRFANWFLDTLNPLPSSQ